MEPLEKLMDVQHERERRFRGFLYSLNPDRTVTLRDLLEDKQVPAKLDAEWIDIPLLRRRFTSLADFFEGIAPHQRVRGYSDLPLVFLQRPNAIRDLGEFARRNRFSHFEQTYGGSPPEALYLHTETNWGGLLEGSWKSRLRIIPPLGSFTSYGQIRHDQNGEEWRDKPMIIGIQVPNYPDLLGVQPTVATDYVARVVAHDMAHRFLPDISFPMESVHNVTAIYAINPNGTRYENGWEGLVHAECTNPYFFLTAAPKIRRQMREDSENRLRTLVLRKFRNWYNARDRTRRHNELWNVEPDMSGREAREQVKKSITEMMATGFPLHQL